MLLRRPFGPCSRVTSVFVHCRISCLTLPADNGPAARRCGCTVIVPADRQDQCGRINVAGSMWPDQCGRGNVAGAKWCWAGRSDGHERARLPKYGLNDAVLDGDRLNGDGTMEKISLTQQGLDTNKEELANLKAKERRAVIQATGDAREYGDLPENAE